MSAKDKKTILNKHTEGWELFPVASKEDAEAMYAGIYAAMEEYASSKINTPATDAETFLQGKNIDTSQIVAYFCIDGVGDGIDIDVIHLMNEFAALAGIQWLQEYLLNRHNTDSYYPIESELDALQRSLKAADQLDADVIINYLKDQVSNIIGKVKEHNAYTQSRWVSVEERSFILDALNTYLHNTNKDLENS